MAGKQACSRCGVSLDDSTPDGYCLSCLLRDGLGEPGEAKPDRASQRFGNYELLEKIGQGGMGVVYRARQINLDRIVALKLPPFGQFSSADAIQRFQAEASAAAGLQHPNIVAIHEVGEHEGQHYFSMDFIEGRTLAEVVREKPLPAKRAAAYLKIIAEAVHYAHQHGILHRDLKPSNVIIDDSDQPRITDFGLAKRLSQTTDHGPRTTDLTLTGQVLGSPSYIPPEQALGKAGKVSRQSDVYALGAMLYHLLTGRPPFQGKTITETLQQVLNTEPAAPRSLNPAIPRELETICLKCLEKETPRRYSTAKALAQDLGRFLDNKPIEARPVGVAGQAWKWCRRRPALAGMGAALALTFMLGLTGVLWQARQARQITYAETHVWGSGNCFYSNGQFHAVGDFRVPTKSILNSFVFGGDRRTWTVPDGMTLEWRAGLVRLDDNATNAAIFCVGDNRGAYIFHKGSRFAYILKWPASGGMRVFSCERAALRNRDVILALALTRSQSNLVITARVLDKRNPKIVLYQRTVVDTPNADPTLTAAQFQALTGMHLVDAVPDAPGPPFTSFGVSLGVFQYTDGKQPVPRAVFDKLEVRTNKAPRISSTPPP